MSHETHDVAHDDAAAAFSDSEWQSLRTEDLSAARAVVILMLSIFLIGVVLYTIVAWSVAS